MIRLHRQPAYERRLIAWAESLIGAPFRWGDTDCAALAVEAIAVIARVTPAAIWDAIPRYRSRAEALRTFAASGGIRAQLLARGLTEHQPRYAHHGDILVIPGGAEGHPTESAAVVVSAQLLTSTDERGVHWCPLVAPAGALAIRI